MSKSIELICGAKAPRGSKTRVPHALRKPAMQPGPVTVIKFANSAEQPGVQGSVSEMLIERGASDPADVLREANLRA